MNHSWAISILKEDAPALAALRLIHGIEVAEDRDEVWLRGKAAGEILERKLAALPAVGRFEWLPANKLRRVDQRVPSRRLPELPWKPILAWSQARAPLAALPAEPPARVALTLVRSGAEKNADLLITSIDDLEKFCANAPAIRLNCLRFAANEKGDVLVHGTPLPPLPGKRFVTHGRVAVAAGHAWQPWVSVEVLERCFSVSGGAILLWHEEGTITRLHSEQFVDVTRSALRATREGLKDSK